MFLGAEDVQSLVLTAKLAGIVTGILFVVGTPIAWWLATSRCRARNVIGAVASLPLVLPPSVLGFYLLLAMGPDGPIGKITQWLGISGLPFTFGGLVVASVFYSLPFMVQPLQSAFESVGRTPMEVASTLRAPPLDAFRSVMIPLCLPGFLTAGTLTFAHTVGEFGVVLMIGGNLPGISRVASVQIYDYVEGMQYSAAHDLALVLLASSFAMLMAMHMFGTRRRLV